MKNFLLKLLPLLLFTITISCTNKNSYSIKGNVDGLEGTVYLALMQGKMPEIIDSTQAINGEFMFKGAVDIPMLAQIQNSAKRNVTTFYIENSKITITGNDKKIDITGSTENDIDAHFRTVLSTPGVDFNTTADSLVAANPKSIAAAYLFYRQLVPYMTHEEMREKLSRFDPSISGIVYLKQVAKRAEALEKVSIGKPYVDFELADTNGNMMKLSDVVGHGKYVLIDFWASWCPPCRAENPNLVANFKRFGTTGFTIFGVSLDKDHASWAKAIEQDELTWTHGSDLKFWNSKPAELYGVGSIPSNVLIDPSGTIIGRNLVGDDLTNTLAKIFGEK